MNVRRAILLGLAFSGCREASHAHPPLPLPAEAPVVAKAPATTPEFDIESQSGSLPMGGTASLMLRIVPKGGWHLSTDYPTRVDQFVSKGAVRPVHAGFRNEPGSKPEIPMTELRLDLGIPVIGERPGAGEFTARARFALCSGDVCAPVERLVAWSVDVREARP